MSYARSSTISTQKGLTLCWLWHTKTKHMHTQETTHTHTQSTVFRSWGGYWPLATWDLCQTTRLFSHGCPVSQLLHVQHTGRWDLESWAAGLPSCGAHTKLSPFTSPTRTCHYAKSELVFLVYPTTRRLRFPNPLCTKHSVEMKEAKHHPRQRSLRDQSKLRPKQSGLPTGTCPLASPVHRAQGFWQQEASTFPISKKKKKIE